MFPAEGRRKLNEDIHLLVLGTLSIACSSSLNDENAARQKAQLAQSVCQPACNVSVELPVGFEPGEDSAIIATESLRLADRVRVGLAGQRGTIANVGGAELEVGRDAQVGHVWSSGNVVFLRGAQVEGDVLAAGTVEQQQGTQVTGTITQGQTLEKFQVSFDVTFPTSSNGNVLIDPNQVSTLQAGERYDIITVKSGAELRVPAGVVYAHELQVEPNGRVVVLGDEAEIYVSGKVHHRGIFQGSAPRIVSVGTDDIHLEASFAGAVVAPGARLIVAPGGNPSRGFFYARDVAVEPDVQIDPHGFPDNTGDEGGGLAVVELGDNPGEVVFDGSNGNTMFPVPATMREFDDLQDYVSFVQAHLNAEPLTDENGELIGVWGTSYMLGDLVFAKDGVTIPVTEPVATYLGGVRLGTFASETSTGAWTTNCALQRFRMLTRPGATVHSVLTVTHSKPTGFSTSPSERRRSRGVGGTKRPLAGAGRPSSSLGGARRAVVRTNCSCGRTSAGRLTGTQYSVPNVSELATTQPRSRRSSGAPVPFWVRI